MGKSNFILIFLIAAPACVFGAEDTATCISSHLSAKKVCARHDSAANAESLAVFSAETRTRAVHKEEAKLTQVRSQCEKVQETCAIVCDEELETASLAGEDISAPLDRLNDCRQGEIQEHLSTIERKLADLKKILQPLNQTAAAPLKSASFR